MPLPNHAAKVAFRKGAIGGCDQPLLLLYLKNTS